jgi:trigger factor
MKYKSKKLPNSIIEVEVTMNHQDFLAYYQPVYDKAFSSVHLNGFRPGAAPKELTDKAIDKEKVFNEAVSGAVRAVLKEVSIENDWQFIDQPKIEVLDADPTADLGLKFKATLSVFPEVKLGDYEKIAKKILEKESTEILIDEEELQKNIKWVLNSRAKLTRINREAKKGDVVDLDFSGFVDKVPLDGASGKADSFVLGEGKFVPGFEESVEGHKEGDDFEFSVNFPKDYWKADLRDKKVDFKVSLKGVYESELPELSDEFVKGLGKFENAEDFKNSVREGMKKEKGEREKERVRLKILQEIIKDSKIDLPQVMVDRTLDGMVAEYLEFRKQSNSKEKEDEGQMRNRLEEKAKNDVATNLVLYQIAKEPNKFLSNSQFSRMPQIDPQKVYDYSYGIIKNRKVFEYLESLK